MKSCYYYMSYCYCCANYYRMNCYYCCVMRMTMKNSYPNGYCWKMNCEYCWDGCRPSRKSYARYSAEYSHCGFLKPYRDLPKKLFHCGEPLRRYHFDLTMNVPHPMIGSNPNGL